MLEKQRAKESFGETTSAEKDWLWEVTTTLEANIFRTTVQGTQNFHGIPADHQPRERFYRILDSTTQKSLW